MAGIVTKAHIVGELECDWWRLYRVISLSSKQQGFFFVFLLGQINSLSRRVNEKLGS